VTVHLAQQGTAEFLTLAADELEKLSKRMAATKDEREAARLMNEILNGRWARPAK